MTIETRAAGNRVATVPFDELPLEVHYWEGDRYCAPRVVRVFVGTTDITPELTSAQIGRIAEFLPEYEG